MKYRTKTLLFAAILLITGVAVYFNSLNNPFHFDDIYLIEKNTKIYEIERIGEFFTSPTLTDAGGFSGYRPIVMSSYSLNYYFSKLNPIPYRMVNIILHVINAILVFFLLKGLMIHIFDMKNEREVFFLSAASSILFLIHPLNTVAINFIWKRTTLLAAIFIFSAICWFVSFHLKLYGSKKVALHRVFSVIFMCFLLIMALFSKETAIVLPLALVLVFVFSKKLSHYKAFILDMLPLAAIASIFTYYRVFMFGDIMRSLGLVGYTIDPAPPFYNYLLSQTEVIMRYILLMFYPQGLSLYHEVAAPQSIFSGFILLRMLFLFSVIVLSLVTFKKYKAFSFSILWFFIFLIPTSFVMSLNILMDEIRVYIPMIAFCMLLAFLGRFFKDNFENRRGSKFSTRLIVVLSILVFGLFSINTIIRNNFYRTEIVAWMDAVEKAPNSILPRLYLGNLFREKGYFEQAAKQFKRAVEISPENRVPKIYLGLAYQQMNMFDESVEQYDKVLAIKDSDFYANQNLGILYSRKGDDEKAIAHLKKAINTNIYGYAAFMELGAVYMRQKKGELALEYLYNAYTLNRYDPLTSRNLALLYFNVLNNPDKAIEYADISLGLEPNQPDLRKLVNKYRKNE